MIFPEYLTNCLKTKNNYSINTHLKLLRPPYIRREMYYLQIDRSNIVATKVQILITSRFQ